MTYREIVSKLSGIKGNTALCPAHNDKQNSLSHSCKNGKILLYCHAGCSVEDIVAALGLKMTDLFEEELEKKSNMSIVTEYDYHNEAGNLTYQVVRLVPKSFRQRRPDGAGGWLWSMKGIKPLPYRLSGLLKALANNETVFVVEGEKDADNLAALGLAATCNHGGAGKWKAEHSEHFTAGADVVILPDNDKAGWDHAAKVANQLMKQGCRVRVLELPGLPEKGDVSDWLAAGGTKEELLKLVGQAAYYEPGPTEAGGGVYGQWRELLEETRYCIDEFGNLCYKKYTERGGDELVPIANFLARPIREVTRDDGLEAEKTFEIIGLLAGGKPLQAVNVSAKDFNSMNWITANWGLGANVEPGSGAKDKVRHAIQSQARGVEQETIFVHLGWRKIGGRWAYLHASGAIGAAGVSVDVSKDRLERYALPEAASPEAVNYSLRLLNIAPLEITIPLFSLFYLAPLCEPLRVAGCEPAFIAWLAGVTGNMKSTLAALFMCHFGEFTGKNLSASFKDTANNLEKKAFLVKDSVLTVDDYHPSASQQEARKMGQIAQQLLRGYGDRVGRGRMRADMTLRPSYIPRGLCLVTGEDTPDAGQSTTARYLAIELKKGEIDLPMLSELQGNTDKLRQAMRGYIEWLAPKLDEIPDKLKARFIQYRNKASQENQHARIPEVVSWLYIGLYAALDYMVEVGAITKGEKAALLESGWQVLVSLAEKQARRITEEQPATKFVNVLSELLASGAANVQDIKFAINQKEPGFIGWHDSDWYYLLPDSAYRVVNQFCNTQGGHFPVTARTLWRHLDTEGLIFTETNGNETRRLIQKKISNRKYRVLQLQVTALKE